MDIMRILKIAFVVMLCVPVAYIAYLLVEQLIDQLARQSGTKQSARTRKAARAARSERKARRDG